MADQREPKSDFYPTLGQLVTRVTNILADSDPTAPNTRWPVAEIVDYINEGCRELMLRRPEAFTRTVRLALAAGSIQYVPDNYQSLVSLEVSYDRVGNESAVFEVDYQYYKLMTKPTLGNASGEYAVLSFTKHPLDPNVFYVEPPVPPGVSPDVLATVVVRPEKFDATMQTDTVGVRPEYEAQVVDWAIYRACSKDVDSTHMSAAAKQYLLNFNTALEYKTGARREYHNAASGLTDKPQPMLPGRGMA